LEGVGFVLGALYLFRKGFMGIDIYLEWEGKDKQPKDDQLNIGLSTTSGHVGYLREAYHGGPYATHILVKEAFESEDNRAKIPAAIMLKRLTTKSKAAKGCNAGHAMAMMLGKLLQKAVVQDPAQIVGALRKQLMAGDLHVPESTTPAMSVEAAVYARCMRLYPEDGDEHAKDVVQSFRDFVELAERREKETGKPCTIYASY
jgi:hypothetical protein